MLAFLQGTQALGNEFKRKGVTAKLSNTDKVKALIEELHISKIREYVYR